MAFNATAKKFTCLGRASLGKLKRIMQFDVVSLKNVSIEMSLTHCGTDIIVY